MTLRLAQIRKAHSMTQSAVASHLGVATNHYAMIERGEKPLRQIHMQALADLWHCKMSDLFGESPNPPKMAAALTALQRQFLGADLSNDFHDLITLAGNFDRKRVKQLLDYAKLLAAARGTKAG